MNLLAPFLILVTAAQAAYDLDYFDRIRTEPSLVQAANQSAANPDRLWEVTDVDGETFQMAQVIAFIPFTDGTAIREAVQDDLAAALMAIHHFNNPELSPHLTPEDLEGCNVKLTTEFHDTKYSPIHSTRLFTDILQRENVLGLPLPAGVIGAYRSAVTSPLAILTGVNDIPQVSYASTSTDFDVKEQYPLFGRTIHSSTGEAKVALDLFKSLEATHVGVLFVTDAFGSALQKAFQDAASEANIVTDSVAFSYSADLESSEIPNAIESLKKTQFKLFYVIAFEVHYEAIMEAAVKFDLIGADYLWIFDGFDSATFHRNAAYPPGSALARATRGVGIINSEGGVRGEILHPGDNNEPPAVIENATSSYERFRTVWRSTIQDDGFDTYARSRLPEELAKASGYNPNYQFGLEAVSFTPFLYDSITALGLSYCRALREADGGSITGSSVFDQFRNLDFNGATGNVKILNDTGTRDFETTVFVLLNTQQGEELDKNGNVVYNLVPTSFFEGKWRPINDRQFVYASGSTEVPSSLPDAVMEMNYIARTGRAVGYSLMGIVIVGALISFLWLLWFRNERVVRASQPIFLFMVALGSLVMASSIVPLSLEEPISESGLNAACMAAPWLYLSGAIIAFSALLAKTRGVRHAYINPELDFIHVTSWDIFGIFSALYLVNFIIMITWHLMAPLEWQRINRDSTDTFDRPVESYGTCSNEDALPFVVVIVVVNILILILANWWAYQARNIETEYHESRFIGIAMASILQAWCMGIPILIVVWDNPQAKFFVEAGIIFVTAVAVLLLIFIPKMLAIRSDRAKAVEESKRIAYNTFTERARNKENYEADDEDEHPKAAFADVIAKNSIPEGPEKAIGATAASPSEYNGVLKASEENNNRRESSDSQSPSSSKRDVLSISNVAKSMRFSSAALSEEEKVASASDLGIRVTHNPRSQRNLEATGGREYSRSQLTTLKNNPGGDEDANEGDDGEEKVGLPPVISGHEEKDDDEIMPSQ